MDDKTAYTPNGYAIVKPKVKEEVKVKKTRAPRKKVEAPKEDSNKTV